MRDIAALKRNQTIVITKLIKFFLSMTEYSIVIVIINVNELTFYSECDYNIFSVYIRLSELFFVRRWVGP